jgi:vancomycin resistance protein YoaR
MTLGSEQAVSELMRIKDRIDRQPQDARVDLKTGNVRPHQDGLWLDVDATLAAMQGALTSGKLRAKAVVVERPPARHTEDLKNLKFPSVLGHFETSYSRSRKASDRTYNLRLAAERLDGTVVMPGETFDFNAVVGPRDEASGYKVATVIEDGELVDGIGGGTCQISGTLHGAVFFAGLEIVERYPHTRPSSYIKMGMDATVVYPTINFRFRNSFDFPIVVHQTVEGGIVRAEILGNDQDQVVTLIRKVDQAIPYEQVERPDPTLPKGNSILAQRGMPGFRLHRYRTIRRGSHTEREKWRDVYPPTNQVVRVGTGPNNLEKRSSVGTPEYQADEVLIITQRRPVDGEPGVLAENRERGRFGAPGWTREAGMPFWENR